MTKRALGNRLREQRLNRGLSSPELGRLVGTSAQTVCRLETNDQPLTLAWITRFANALGCEPADILPVSFLPMKARLEAALDLKAELSACHAKIADLERRLNLIRDITGIGRDHE